MILSTNLISTLISTPLSSNKKPQKFKICDLNFMFLENKKKRKNGYYSKSLEAAFVLERLIICVSK